MEPHWNEGLTAVARRCSQVLLYELQQGVAAHDAIASFGDAERGNFAGIGMAEETNVAQLPSDRLIGAESVMAEPRSDNLNFGLPNWRNEDEYPRDDAPIELWHWQFIRRRKDYRDDWHKYNNMASKLDIEVNSGDGAMRPHCPEFVCNIPNSLDKYGLHKCPNPSYRELPASWQLDIFGDFNGYPHTPLSDVRQSITVDIDPLCVWVPFKINREFSGQIKNIRKLLECIRNEMEDKFDTIQDAPKRKRVRNWRTYLRALDAREDGQTLSTIAREILKPKNVRFSRQAASETLRQAEHLKANFPL